MKRYVTTLLENTEQVPTVRIGISYCSPTRLKLPAGCNNLSTKILFFQNHIEQLTAPLFWIRSGNMVLVLLIRQTAKLADIFQTMLLALLCCQRFLDGLLRKKPFTLSDLVVRTPKAKSVTSLLDEIMNDSQPLNMLTLVTTLCNLVPYGGRITLYSSLNLSVLTHSLMMKNVESALFSSD